MEAKFHPCPLWGMATTHPDGKKSTPPPSSMCQRGFFQQNHSAILGKGRKSSAGKDGGAGSRFLPSVLCLLPSERHLLLLTPSSLLPISKTLTWLASMLGHSPMTTADSHGLRTRVSGQKIWWDCFPLRHAPHLCSSQQMQTQSPGPPFSRGYRSRVILKARMLRKHLCINLAIAATCDPWVGKIPWRRAWQPTPVFLPEESHGQRSLGDYSPWALEESDKPEGTWHRYSYLKAL